MPGGMAIQLFLVFEEVLFIYGALTIANNLKRLIVLKLLKVFNLKRFGLYILCTISIITLLTFYIQDVSLLQGSELSKVSITGKDATVTIKAPVCLVTGTGKQLSLLVVYRRGI